MELKTLLAEMVELDASDLFISASAPPCMQIEGEFRAVRDEKITSMQARALAYSVLTKDQVQEFELENELNASYRIEDVGRFRLNVFRQMGEVALVARHIRANVPTLAELGLPPIFRQLALEDRGLILVVGGTGTGKSTTLAAIIDYRNRNKPGHILTIEEPVEFVHENRKSIVNQREVGVDTESYEIALKNALRESPNVIMIGEIRDVSTMKKAIAYAESGHLCVSTLHANSASDAIDRILNFFPSDAYQQLFMDLASHLRAVASLRLPVGFDGKRVAAVEVMLGTPYISGLISEGDIGKLKDAMKKEEGEGCQTFDQSLFHLVRNGKISKEEALINADSRNNLNLRFRLEGHEADVEETLVKDVAFAKTVDYQSFNNYKITPSALKGGQPIVMQNIEDGLQNVLMARGLSIVTEDADLEIRYYSSRAEDMAASSSNADSEVDQLIQQHGIFGISILDNASGKTVWRVRCPNRYFTAITPQGEINQFMNQLLANFPPD